MRTICRGRKTQHLQDPGDLGDRSSGGNSCSSSGSSSNNSNTRRMPRCISRNGHRSCNWHWWNRATSA